MELVMMNVKSSNVKFAVAELEKRKKAVALVRDGMVRDSDLFDDGVDCSVGDDGGELVSKTKQSFKDECDINEIMRRYERTGVLDHVAMTMPQYGEYISELSYQQSLDAVRYAEAQFAALDARIRDRFGNSPAQLLAFLDDPANLEEAVELGLVQKPVIPEPGDRKVDVPKGPAERPAQPAQAAQAAGSTMST